MRAYDRNGRLKVKAGVSFDDGPNLDAFDRLRVSQPTGLFDTQFQYTQNTLLWETVITGAAPPTATHAPNESAIDLALTADNQIQAVLRQSRQYHRYQPGRSQLIQLTFNFNAATATGVVKKEVGYGDDDNGIFLYQTSSGVGIRLRSKVTGSVVDTDVAQTSWNIDKMNGTGPSGITIDWTKAQIFATDLQWLGVGRVRYYLKVGAFYPIHEINNANANSTTYMTTACLPIRYKISKTASTDTGTLKQICSAVFSEGGFELERGYPFSAFNSTTGITTTGTARRPILSIRPAATLNSIVNRGMIIPESVGVFISSNHTVLWELVYGGALTGAAFAAVDGTHSITERDSTATAITGGITISPDFASSTNQSRVTVPVNLAQRLPLTLDTAGANPINLSLVVTSFSGDATCHGVMKWRELR